MRMDIDPTWGHQQSGGINFLTAWPDGLGHNTDNARVNGNIRLSNNPPSAINNGAPADD